MDTDFGPLKYVYCIYFAVVVFVMKFSLLLIQIGSGYTVWQ